jgi:hypothetical protein
MILQNAHDHGATAGEKTLQKREAAFLNQGLEKRLFAYALVASVGVTLKSAAHAEIVYTPVYRRISGFGGDMVLDLNKDGIADFDLFISTSSDGLERTRVKFLGNASYKIIGTPFFSPFRFTYVDGAAALKSGAYIGRGAKFIAKGGDVLTSNFQCRVEKLAHGYTKQDVSSDLNFRKMVKVTSAGHALMCPPIQHWSNSLDVTTDPISRPVEQAL